MLESWRADRLHSQTLSSAQGDNVTERLFYSDCSPESARNRTKRAEEIADILNSSRGFGTERAKQIIRSAFQAEVEASNDAAEAASKMARLVSIINLRLEKGFGLGPEKMPVKSTLYFVIEGIAFSQRLSLDLKPTYKKDQAMTITTTTATRERNPFAA